MDRLLRYRFSPVLPIFIASFCGWACNPTPAPPADLTQAAQAMRSLTKPSVFRRTAFAQTSTDPTPSNFVEYLFSDLGVAEWPERESWYPEDEHPYVGPLLPDHVTVVPLNPDPTLDTGELQLVLVPNDEKNVILAEGYTDIEADPVLSQEWPMPSLPGQ